MIERNLWSFGGLALALTALGGCTTMTAAPTVTLTGPAAAISGPIPAVPTETMREVIRTLASDAFEGRAPSTAAEPKVLAEIVSRFKAAGLQPGNHGSWLQDVPTVEISAVNAAPLTVTGGAAPLSYKLGDDFVINSYRVTPRTRIADSELVFVGYGINAPELGWNDYAGVDMRGKTAVILINDPDYASESQDGTFKGRRMTYYGRWTYKYEEAARQGATAALIVHDTFPAAYPWKVVNSSNTGAQYKVQTADDGADQTAANGWIQKPVAEAIMAASGKSLAALSAAAGQRGFHAVPLGLKASLAFDNAIRRDISHNVIGILPGRTRPDEYVLNTAHWDHLGHCTPDRTGDDICNGALDNASGVAGLVALAEMNHAAGPAERTQVFLSVTLEESGLLGSEYYARNPVFPLSRTVGGVNMDGISPVGPARDYSSTGDDKSELGDTLVAVLEAMHLRLTPEQHTERGSYYRSDHFSFAKQGVPMLDVRRGLDLVDGGTAAGDAAQEDYVANRYHAPADQYYPGWAFVGPAQNLEVLYRVGRALAMGSSWPNWRRGDEFRAIRDRSCAATTGGC